MIRIYEHQLISKGPQVLGLFSKKGFSFYEKDVLSKISVIMFKFSVLFLSLLKKGFENEWFTDLRRKDLLQSYVSKT